MLTIALTSFFILALVGGMSVIGMMFFGYRERIKQVILDELGSRDSNEGYGAIRYQSRPVKVRQTNRPVRLSQSIPLRAAA